MILLYMKNIEINCFNELEQISEKKNIGRNIINQFSDNHYEYILGKEQDKKEFIWGKLNFNTR